MIYPQNAVEEKNMSLNEALNELNNAQQEIEKLKEELASVKEENKKFKETQFINSLKLSSNRRGW